MSSFNNDKNVIPWSKRHKQVTKSADGGLPYPSMSNSFAEPLTMTELMDWCRTPQHQHLIDEYLNHSLVYTTNGGSADLKQAVADVCYKDTNITADDIVIFPGAQVALQTIHKVLCHHTTRDEKMNTHVLSFTPGYQSVTQGPALNGATSVTYLPRSPNTQWQLDLSQIMDATQPNTAYMVLNEPYNPAGTIMPRPVHTQLIQWASSQHNMFLVCDEVYRGMEHDQQQQLPSMCVAYPEGGVSVVTLSKSWGTCGTCIGWVATQNKALRHALQNAQYFGTACPCRSSELQALMVLHHSDRILQRNRSILLSNKELLCQFMDEYGAWFDWVPPTAGAICAVRFLGPMSSQELGQVLAEEYGIGIKPAYCFMGSSSNDGEDDDSATPIPAELDYFRIGFGESCFPASLAALRRFVEDHCAEWEEEKEKTERQKENAQNHELN